MDRTVLLSQCLVATKAGSVHTHRYQDEVGFVLICVVHLWAHGRRSDDDCDY